MFSYNCSVFTLCHSITHISEGGCCASVTFFLFHENSHSRAAPECTMNPPPHASPMSYPWCWKLKTPTPPPPFFIQTLRHWSSSDDVKTHFLLQLLLEKFARARPNVSFSWRLACGGGRRVTSQKTWLFSLSKIVCEDRDAAPLVFGNFSPNL